MMRTLLTALLILPAACSPGPHMQKVNLGPIPGIEPGQNPEQVVKVLGKPMAAAPGAWDDDMFELDMESVVWAYEGKGRVVFNRWTHLVETSEQDPTVGKTLY